LAASAFLALATTAHAAAELDARRMANAESEPGAWMGVGRTYAEQRYSPLKQVNTDNDKQLGLAWSFEYDRQLGLEATTLDIDGVMYVPSYLSEGRACNAKSGTLLSEFGPEVRGDWRVNGC